MTLATILCRMVLVDNIGTNAFGADVVRIKQVQSDVVILERITGAQETMLELVLQIYPKIIIIPSNTTHDIINENVVHTNIFSYYITEGCSEDLIIVSSQLLYRDLR